MKYKKEVTATGTKHSIELSERLICREVQDYETSKQLKEAYRIGNLTAYKDGLIASQSSVVKLTPQLKRLHGYFISKYDKAVQEKEIKGVAKTKGKDKKIAYKLCSRLNKILTETAGTDKKEKFIHCNNKTWTFKNKSILMSED
ncbi:MAG: hypothetical protein HYY52_06775 [Candidatus Melainabacteria bacterium]|nr:hypothetical protein [Candidatus Melainabacteria bacterium]